MTFVPITFKNQTSGPYFQRETQQNIFLSYLIEFVKSLIDEEEADERGKDVLGKLAEMFHQC